MSKITKEAIFEAADKLASEGQNPTLAAVRKVLGGGSFTTISEAMSEWRADRQAPTSPIREVAPAVLLGKLSDFADELWSAALDLANARLKSEREALEAARLEMEQQQKEAAELADQMAADIEYLTKSLEEARLVSQELSDRLEAESKVAQELRIELSASSAKVDELEKRLIGSQEQIVYIQSELFVERERLEKLTESERANAGLISQLQTENAGLLDLMKEKEQRADRDVKRAESRAEKMEAERDKARNEIAELSKSSGALVGELEALRKQVADQSALIKSLTSSSKTPAKKKEDQ